MTLHRYAKNTFAHSCTRFVRAKIPSCTGMVMSMNVHVYKGNFACPHQCMIVPVHKDTFALTFLVHECTNVFLAYLGTLIFLINKSKLVICIDH
jgi:hypothetical protein